MKNTHTQICAEQSRDEKLSTKHTQNEQPDRERKQHDINDKHRNNEAEERATEDKQNAHSEVEHTKVHKQHAKLQTVNC